MKEAAMKSPLAALTAFSSYLLGTLSELVIVLIYFMILDMVTGLIRSFLTKSWNSSFGLRGIFKKVAVLIVIGVSAGVEYALTITGMDSNGLLTIMVICFFVVNEGISILENSAQIGVPIPGILMDALEKLKQESGKERKVKRRKKSTE